MKKRKEKLRQIPKIVLWSGLHTQRERGEEERKAQAQAHSKVLTQRK